MFLNIPGIKKGLNCVLAGIFVAGLSSCGSYNNNNPYASTSITTQSRFPLTAYVSNPVEPTGLGSGAPALNILDATHDVVSISTISLFSLSAIVRDAGMMALSPKRDRTLVLSPADGRIAIVSNTQGSVSSAVALGGSTESFFVANDNVTAWAAVPNAAVSGQAPGAVERIDLASGAITATIAIPGAHYVVPSPDSSAMLVFSDNSNAVTLLIPSLIGIGVESDPQAQCSATQSAACVIPGSFDRPVWAVFNGNGTKAYILNCGQQCGGTGSGACLSFTSCTTVSTLDMTQGPPAGGTPVSVPAATMAVLQGNNLFIAGTPYLAADNACTGVKTAAPICGRLTVVDVSSMTATGSFPITDGYHNRMQVASGGQLFIGSRNCTNVNAAGEVRGCLTIANSTSGALSDSNIVAPPDNGDVTGIEPIPGRTVVYVCEGGNLRIYDTTTDKLKVFKAPATVPSIPGQAVDVKIATF